MAVLPNADMDSVWKELMSEFSSIRKEIPVTKDQFRNFIVNVDTELEQAEINIVQSVPAGPNRQWLVDNPEVGRSMVMRVMAKRREVL